MINIQSILCKHWIVQYIKYTCLSYFLLHYNFLYDVSRLILTAIDHRFNHRSGQIKEYKSSICCFSDKYVASRRKSRDWLAQSVKCIPVNRMSACGLLFQWANFNWVCWSSGECIIIILFLLWYRNNCSLVIKQQSITILHE